MQLLYANNIARQVEGKISYRRAIKMAIASTMRMGAEGIKVIDFRTTWMEPKWHVQKCIRKEEYLFIPLVQILIMPLEKHIQKLVRLVLKFGFAKEKYLAKEIYSPNIGRRDTEKLVKTQNRQRSV